jgi:hypothetical protein
MHVANSNDTTPAAEDLGKKAIDQVMSASIGYQEAMRSFAKARFAFYGAWMLFGLNLAQTAITSFVGEKE